MKRENFFYKVIQTALVFGMLILAVVCGLVGSWQEPSAGESVNLVEGSGEEGKQISINDPETDSAGEEETALEHSTDSLGVKTEPAVLTQDEQEIGIQGNTLTYGGLTVELPDGIEARLIDAEDNGNFFNTAGFLSEGNKGRILDLCGAQEVYADRVGDDWIEEVFLDLPPRVRLLHYKAAYDSEMALLCALFDLLPEAIGYHMYADGEKEEYAYRLQQDGYLFFVLVRNEDVYLVQEMEEEEDCSFDALLTDGAVRWEESGEAVGFWQEPDDAVYRKIVPEEGISLLYVCEERESLRRRYKSLRLYREGYYETPCQTLQANLWYEHRTYIGDVNFDGCSDIVGVDVKTASDDVYLWNQQTKTYEQAQGEDGCDLYIRLQLPETKSIWGVTTYEIPEDWKPIYEAEAIWQWEGNTLVKKRECVVSIRKDGLRVWAYEGTPDKLLFDETFSLEEWEQEEQGRVRLLYEQFYDGMAPKELYAKEHRMEGERKLPQEFLDEIKNVMAAGKDAAILSRVGDGKESAVLSETNGKYADWLNGMVSGKILTQEDALALAGRDTAVRQQVQRASLHNYRYTLMEADCDNDGWADLIWQLDGHYIGGVSGTVEYVFLKGQPDGGYVESDGFYEQRESFHVIAYEGRNYLCYADFDSDRMIYNGYTVQCYEDGKRVEEAAIHMVPERYEIRQVSADEGYENLAVRMAGECAAVKERVDGRRILRAGGMIGDAEQLEKDASAGEVYICDLDNDGQKETYNKDIWRLSLFDGGAHMELHVEKYGGEKEHRGIKLLTEEIENSIDTPMALWVDAYEGKNIVHVLYMTGLDDYRIAGYLVEEMDYSKVYEIQVDAAYKAEQERQIMF